MAARRTFAALLLLLVAVLALPVSLSGAQSNSPSSQQATGTATLFNPEANISFPPPVYLLRGAIDIRGTADLPDMLNYFLEFRRLGDDLSVPDASAPWIPATLPVTQPVVEGILGTWNTTITGDGLYELRLTVNVRGQQPITYRVSPLRVENVLPPFVTPEGNQGPSIITATRPVRATLAPTPTPFAGRPTVTAVTDANVRQGDSLIYPVIGSLLTGQTATVVGISSGGSGWYYIQLSTGRRGFISPSVVSFAGTLDDVPLIQPPATPTPTFTPTPPFSGDLIINGNALVPDSPRCNEQFEVQLNVANIGAASTSSQVTVRIQDQDILSGTVTNVVNGTLPIIMEPGRNFVVVIPITVSSFGGRDHRITATVDANNQVIEENENNNTFSFDYRLRLGTCPPA